MLFSRSWGKSFSLFAVGALALGVATESAPAQADLPKTSATSDGDLVVPMSKSDTKKVLAWISKEIGFEQQPYCYKQSYGRGAGKPLSTCGGGDEKNGALCYPDCKAGYHGAGPVCWEECKSGYHDDGATCRRDADIFGKSSYGRGAGYPWKGGDKPFSLDGARSRCSHAHPEGCEKDGEIIYPRCKSGFHKVGCCVCSQDSCPSGYHDDGATCRRDVDIYAKKSYGRGAGEPMGCASPLEKDAALCYASCKTDYKGVGPVCWQRCPSSRPVECGAGCAMSTKECASNTADMVIAPLEMAVQIALLITTAGAGDEAMDAAKTAAKTAVKTALKSGATDAEKTAAKAAFKGAMEDIAKGFEKVTTKRIAEQMKKKFTQGVYKYLAKEYVKTVYLTAEGKGLDDAAKSALLDLASLDPTGTADVIEAFAKPVCDSDEPIPEVKLVGSAASAPPPAVVPPAPKSAGYHWDEAKNPGGPNRCHHDDQCDGLRVCTGFGWCTGRAR